MGKIVFGRIDGWIDIICQTKGKTRADIKRVGKDGTIFWKEVSE